MKKKSKTKWYRLKANQGMGWSQDGRGIGHRDHFLLYKFIKRSFECWATSTKQLMNAGGGHQAPGPFSLKVDRSKYKRQKETQKI